MRRAKPHKRKASPPGVPFEGRIESLGAQGDGIAPGPDGPVYVPLTVPGDVVRGVRRGARAEVAAILDPGPDRVVPPCPHFGACGGCALQHVAPTALAAWKREMVAAALAARGLGHVPVRETLTVPAPSRRRVTLSVQRERGGVRLGFMGRRSHEVTRADGCLILTPALAARWDDLETFAAAVAGHAPNGQIHVLASETGLDVDLRIAADTDDPRVRMALIEAGADLDAARLSVDGEILAAWRDPAVIMGAVRVTPPPGGFLQPGADGQAALCDLVHMALGEGDGPVADLFAGSGTFTFALAARRPVDAFEADPEAVAALTRAARQTAGLKPVTATRRDLFRRPLMPLDLKRYTGAVIDPPRAGALEQCQALAASQIRRIASVSCNPATFARDARCLVDGGYTVRAVHPVDQFAWSTHIECVGVFERE